MSFRRWIAVFVRAGVGFGLPRRVAACTTGVRGSARCFRFTCILDLVARVLFVEGKWPWRGMLGKTTLGTATTRGQFRYFEKKKSLFPCMKKRKHISCSSAFGVC